MSSALLKRTSYPDYPSYLQHQGEKLTRSGGEAYVQPEVQVEHFRQRFAMIPDLPEGQSVLCLGARRGEEVRAWRMIGHQAMGVDVNPGADNPDVVVGDFHDLPFEKHGFSVVYTNSLDHAYDLEKVCGQMRRMVSGTGWIVLDLVSGYAEGYHTGGRDCLHWPTAAWMAWQVAELLGWPVQRFLRYPDDLAPYIWQVVYHDPR